MSVARHSVYNLVGSAVPVALALISVPLLLHLIGLERFGVLSLCWVLVGYLHFMDFGLGRATTQRLAALRGASGEERSGVFWTGMSLSLGLAIAMMLVLAPVLQSLIQLLTKVPESLREEVTAALPLLLVALPIGITQSLMRGALDGRLEFGRSNLIMGFGAVGTTALPLLAAWALVPNLAYLIGATLLARIATIAALAVACVRAVPVLRFSTPSRADAGQMLRFGGWLTVTTIVGPLMMFMDRFAVGALLGAASVAIYVIPFNLVTQLLLVPNAVAAALFPRFAEKELHSARDASEQALRGLALITTPMAMGAMICVGPFLQLWVGQAIAAPATPVAIVLLAGFWANSLAQVPFGRLQAGGRTDVTAKLHLVEVLPYLALLYLLLSSIGLVGAAIVWAVRATVDFIALLILDKAPRATLLIVLKNGVAVWLVAMLLLMPLDLLTKTGIAAAAAALGFLLLAANERSFIEARVRATWNR